MSCCFPISAALKRCALVLVLLGSSGNFAFAVCVDPVGYELSENAYFLKEYFACLHNEQAAELDELRNDGVNRSVISSMDQLLFAIDDKLDAVSRQVDDLVQENADLRRRLRALEADVER